MRWLNRREFLKFQVIDDGNDNFKEIPATITQVLMLIK